MQQVDVKEAETKLAELMTIVAQGEEVVIRGVDGSTFKLLRIEKMEPYPKFGSAKGLIEMSKDFDEPIKDFEEYMP